MRRLANPVLMECLRCRRHHPKPCSQPVPTLPKERVTSAQLFNVTDLYYADLLFCADCPCKKNYVFLFSRGVVRAIHLELTESLCLSDCILAIRRFVARRVYRVSYIQIMPRVL